MGQPVPQLASKAALARAQQPGLAGWVEAVNRSCSRALLLGALVVGMGLPPTAWARPGVVQTRDGRTLHGELRLTNDAVVVSASNITVVPLTELAMFRFEAAPLGDDSAQGGQGHGLLGYYFNGTNFTGDVVVRLDPTIDFDWGTGAPVRGLGRDLFSVIWMGELEPPVSGTYTVGIEVDDGGRLFLDNQLLCARWARQGQAEAAAQVRLQAYRRYALRFEYCEFWGTASARLFWSGPGIPRQVIPRGRLYARSFLDEHPAEVRGNRGLLATYYRNSNLTGPTFTRVDPTIDLDGTESVPEPSFSRNSFSARWTGQVRAPRTDVFTLYLVADELARLWINDQLLLEVAEPGVAERGVQVPLRQGQRYDVCVEARNTGGGLVARLLWSSPALPKTVVPAADLLPWRPSLPSSGQTGGGLVHPAGVLLRNGSFLAGSVQRATETVVEVRTRGNQRVVSTPTVARLYLQPVREPLLMQVSPGRRGVLLPSGDFVDGLFRRLEAGRLRLSSILFGARTFQVPQDVLAVFIQDLAIQAQPFEVRLCDGSVFCATRVRLAVDTIQVHDPLLGPELISAEDLESLARY
jgi:hypothetical protein